MYPIDAYHDSDFEDPPMDDDDHDDCEDQPPATDKCAVKPKSATDDPYAFVRVAMVLGRLAIVEKGTAEPIQFIPTAGRSGVELTAHAEKLAGQWNEHFQDHIERSRVPR